MRANLFYTNPRVSVLLVLFIVVLGGAAFQGLARQEDPKMAERYAGVITFLPGATALRMETLISEPIETALREIPEIKELTSSSKAGQSVVGVELYESVPSSETDNVWSEVRDILGDTVPMLSPGTIEPELEIRQPIASTIIVALSWQHPSESQLGILSRIAETLRVNLANTQGTEIAETWGEAEEEIRVGLDPYKLVASGMSAGRVASAIAQADTKIPAGRLRSGSSDMLVEVQADLKSTERIARIPLAVSANNQTLRVSDIASVSKTTLDPPRSLAFHGSERVIFVNAKMRPGLQIESWTKSALTTVNKLDASLPDGIGLDVVYLQNTYTGDRMVSLGTNLVFALILVLLLLIWMMGLRSALTVGVALPLSGSMVLVGMMYLQIPLHQMSVTGLIISLGLLIDNAIVVVEDYKLKRKRGAQISTAIEQSIQHLWVPLGASTATTVFAFMPIALAPGGVGDFTGTLGVTVALSVASSFLLAMTVIPAFAGYLENRWPSRGGGRWWQQGFSNPSLAAAYRRTLQVAINRPIIGIGAAFIMPFIGFALAPTLTNQFFPAVDRNQFQVQIALPSQASIWETRDSVVRANEVLRSYPNVTDTFWTIGEGAPRVYYNVVSLNERVPSFASGWVNTTSAVDTEKVLKTLQDDLSRALPEAEVLAIPFEQGPPTNAPIELRIIGPDLNVLGREAQTLRALVSALPKVTFVRATLSTAEPKLAFAPRENAAAAGGLSTGELAQNINSLLSGQAAGTVLEGNRQIPVRVQLADRYRNDMADLTTLPMLANNRDGIPLQELGEWQLQPTASAIDRRQGERLSTVQAFLQPFTLPDTVMQDIRATLAEKGYQPPPGYRLSVGGVAEESAESMGNIVSVFVFFALAMTAVVILSLNSFRQAGLIGLVAILSFGLALLGLRIFGYPFGYMALIGALGMMGLAINGAIIVLSALKASPEASSGETEAVVNVVMDASRHIISTTLTTIGGFIPLIVNGGKFWPPLATAIAGGVAGSAIIALYLIPASYAAIQRKRAGKAPPAEQFSQPVVTK
ncbi:efflux RND transporter permease subunit [Pseudomonadales bacterium]|nr:efflux RND transporter permease subunit [Pseudomonadales bacterium]